MDTDEEETIMPTENRDSLNLKEVEVVPPHFYLLVKIQVETIKIIIGIEIV